MQLTDADAFRDLIRPSPKADPFSLEALLHATREHPIVHIPGIAGGVVRGVGTLKADKYLGECGWISSLSIAVLAALSRL
jgi:hypothetical protein